MRPLPSSERGIMVGGGTSKGSQSLAEEGRERGEFVNSGLNKSLAYACITDVGAEEAPCGYPKPVASDAGEAQVSGEE